MSTSAGSGGLAGTGVAVNGGVNVIGGGTSAILVPVRSCRRGLGALAGNAGNTGAVRTRFVGLPLGRSVALGGTTVTGFVVTTVTGLVVTTVMALVGARVMVLVG